MEAEAHDGVNLHIPLMFDNGRNQNQLGEVESLSKHHTTGNASFCNTCLNGLNALSGVGILSTTYALSSGGWLSLILLFVIAITTFYTSLLLKKCLDMDPNIRSYADIGARAFGTKGRLMALVFMNAELYSVATGFLILEGDNLYNLLPNLTHFELIRLQICGKQGFVIIVGLILLPSVWFNNMNILGYISGTGVLASVIILGSILWLGAFDGIGFDQKGSVVNWKGVPIAISLYVFSYSAHPLFPTLYTSMRNKHQFSKVLIVCFLTSTIIYAAMTVFGYLMFGSEVQSQITLNLPINKLSSRVAIYTALINPISKYALMLTPLVDAVESRLLRDHNKILFRFLIKTVIVISTIVITSAVPFFGFFMSLVGAFISVTASILLPCLCYLKISGTYQRFGFELVIIGAIMLVGISTLIVSTYSSLVQLIGHL